MPANLSEAIPYILFALAMLFALWLMFSASRTTTVVDRTSGDVLDEGAAPAARNQALIDAPKAADPIPEPAPAPSPAPASAPAQTDAPTPAPAPAPEPTPAPSPTASAAPDDLKRIKGVGPKLASILAEQGVTSFADIAAWSAADIERVDATLGRFAGRIARDNWVEQAKLLAAGDDAGFVAKFGEYK